MHPKLLHNRVPIVKPGCLPFSTQARKAFNAYNNTENRVKQ